MRFSSRLPGRLDSNALSQALAETWAKGQVPIDLTISNPIAAGLVFPPEPLRSALGSPAVSLYQPDPQGTRSAREAVAAWHGHGLGPEEVQLTASTSEAYSWLFKLLCDPGDDVLVPSPSYPLFEWLARLEGISTRAVPAYYHERWNLDEGALEEALTPRTRAVVVVNPNNPTGHYLTRSEWERLTDFCARHRLALLVDEVFSDYRLEPPAELLPTALEAPEPPCPVFVLSGLSKIAGLPQVKLGWILSLGEQARRCGQALAFIADQYLSASASAQAAVPELLRLAPAFQEEILARLRGNLARLDELLAGHPGVSRLPVEGGWTVLLRRPALDSDEACALRLLREGGVLVHPGHFFDLPGDGFLVLSLLASPHPFRQGLQQLLPLLSELP